MVGKMMLPLLGGAASVWITCLLFFQLMLLAGYGYAHLLERYAAARAQLFVHSVLLLAAGAFLPIHFAARPDAIVSSHPVLWLLWELLKSVGLPFGIVSTTAPLLQNWLAKTRAISGKDPYFLYAVSNAGSLLALIAYPVLLEPRLGVSRQSLLWTGGYAGLVLLVIAAAAILWRGLQTTESNAAEASPVINDTESIPWRLRIYWLLAALVPSALMLAVTNHMLLDLASVPFLWVIPLALYLLTFMIAFGRRFRPSHLVLSWIVPVILLVLFPFVAANRAVSVSVLWYVLGTHMLVMFAGALLCHTALASRRPGTRHLTEFYFWVALGGALGGIFTAVIAPGIFATVVEYPLIVATIAFFRETRETGQKLNWSDFVFPAALGALVVGASHLLKWASVDITENLKASLAVDAALVLIACLFLRRRVRFALALAALIFGYHYELPKFFDDAQVLTIRRNFFGIKKVVDDMDANQRKLLHGDTLHGVESQDPAHSGEPLSYYHATGPAGDVMKMIENRPNQHVGVVGLGTGSMAGYANPARRITFFDIDPQVYGISHDFFTFLRRCDRRCDVVIGDGRLSIEHQHDGEFDVLMLDAFNSDSIPAHLVSREAVQIYLKKLKPDGVILFHVSNRYMNVEGLVSAVLIDASLTGLVRYDDDDDAVGKAASDYVIAARRPEDFGSLQKDENWSHVEKPAGIQPWTDDYSNMMQIVRWH